jgi:hypothetical protein
VGPGGRQWWRPPRQELVVVECLVRLSSHLPGRMFRLVSERKHKEAQFLVGALAVYAAAATIAIVLPCGKRAFVCEVAHVHISRQRKRSADWIVNPWWVGRWIEKIDPLSILEKIDYSLEHKEEFMGKFARSVCSRLLPQKLLSLSPLLCV